MCTTCAHKREKVSYIIFEITLFSQIQNLGDTSEVTKLVMNLTDIDPDDAFSIVPYEKGHTFLFYLEQLLGGPEVFEPYLKSYLDTYKYKSIETDTWKKHLYEYFSDKTKVMYLHVKLVLTYIYHVYYVFYFYFIFSY